MSDFDNSDDIGTTCIVMYVYMKLNAVVNPFTMNNTLACGRLFEPVQYITVYVVPRKHY